jgi:major vault protein
MVISKRNEQGKFMSEDFSEKNNRRERDMILAPNEYCFISDETKGEVNCFVGPNKTSLAGTDRCVIFDLKSKRFKAADLSSGIQLFQTAPEGWYVILKNVAVGDKHPNGGGKLTTPDLKIGKKVNISGPVSFALWPGQMAKTVQGHNLRSNEYLLVRVYDEDAARENWNKSVIKAQVVEGDTAKETVRASLTDIPTENDLTMGKLFIIKGTEVSFYIPSTGIEVVPERGGAEERYVREAVTLERLEYCLLLDQNGSKRYVHGPAVVFPQPTEKFVDAPIKSSPDTAKAKKFRAQELTPASGIHIRVIADYTEADGTIRKAGEELFITGKEQTIYFPREEHAIIKYGNQEIHYGITIPEGEARYSLDRNTGAISLVKGPRIFLPDPRTQVIAQRALPLNLCQLMYPGNAEALAINAARLGLDDSNVQYGGGGEASMLYDNAREASYDAVSALQTPDTTRRVMIKGASKSLPGDTFDRKTKFTAPRSVVLNTKFDGAVQTTLWTGYAMLLVRKNGDRRVVQGPGTFMLEYDESPQVITLSRGKPKSTANPLKTVFLLSTANKVSDLVEVETKDFCKLNVSLSFRVNFTGNPEKWFNVDNYVKFLCDHMRSRIRGEVQKLGVEEFYGNHTDIIRNIVLGKSIDNTPRPGVMFEENGMHIYDVEVLNVGMQNSDIEKMLIEAQRGTIQNALALASERRKFDYLKSSEEIKRQILDETAETKRKNTALQEESFRLQMQVDLAQIETSAKAEAERQLAVLANAEAESKVKDIQLESQAKVDSQKLESMKQTQELEVKKLEAQVQALVEKAKAVSPDLIAALSAFGERAMVEKVAQSMAPLSILGGDSVIDVLKKLLEGTSLANQLAPALQSTNGTSRSKSVTTSHA